MTLRFVFRERPELRRYAGALALLSSLAPRPLLAQALPIDLTWSAPAECPQREEVLARASGLLVSAPPKGASVQARGSVQRRDDGFELELAIGEDGQGGERKFWARQCPELGGAAAVALVLLLTTGSTEQESSAGDETAAAAREPVAETASPPASEHAETPSPVVPRPRSWRALAAAPQLSLGIGPLPKPTLGLGLGLGVESHGWFLRLFGQLSARQQVPAPTTGFGAEVRRGTAGVWGCRALLQSSWELSPCLHVTLVQLWATGYGPSLKPASQSRTAFALGAGAVGRLRASDWLALMVGVSGQLELSRPVLLLNRVGTVRQLAPVSATLLLGPEWMF
jgi:hypothetical protein